MLRKLVALTAALTAFAVGFAATSAAFSRNVAPRLRPNLAAAALPITSLSDDEAVRINNSIGANARIAGITTASYAQVRLLERTAAGPLYLIPGSHGTCLFLGYASVCGDPGGTGRINALVAFDASRQMLVGGGVADASVRRVDVIAGSGARASSPVRNGSFAIALSARDFTPGDGVKFVAR